MSIPIKKALEKVPGGMMLVPLGIGAVIHTLAPDAGKFFGSFTGLERQLTEAAMNIQGSGWGALGWEPLGRRLVVEQVYDHQGNVGVASTPILVFDAWEHAFYLQYKNQKVDFIEAMWRVVNWQDVAKRYAAAK